MSLTEYIIPFDVFGSFGNSSCRPRGYTLTKGEFDFFFLLTVPKVNTYMRCTTYARSSSCLLFWKSLFGLTSTRTFQEGQGKRRKTCEIFFVTNDKRQNGGPC